MTTTAKVVGMTDGGNALKLTDNRGVTWAIIVDFGDGCLLAETRHHYPPMAGVGFWSSLDDDEATIAIAFAPEGHTCSPRFSDDLDSFFVFEGEWYLNG